MTEFSKNQKIIVGGIILALVLTGIFYFALKPGGKGTPPAGQSPGTQEKKEIFSVAGVISEIDTRNNSLVIKTQKEDKEFKVNLNEETEIIKIKFPFDPKNPPAEATFTPERVSATIDDLKNKEVVLIETSKDISGKTEFDDVTRIQVLP